MQHRIKPLAILIGLTFFGQTHASAAVDCDIDDDGLIEISSLADLNEIRNNLDGTSLYGSSEGCPESGCSGFELTEELNFDTNGDGTIDASDQYWNDGLGWTPIGDEENPFTATLKGNEYKIKNLMINQPNLNYVGLFSVIDHASILDLGITGPAMSVRGSSHVGGLTGLANSDNYVKNVFVNGSIEGLNYVGGLSGTVEANNTFLITYAAGSVSAQSSVGGLIGQSSTNNIVNIGYSAASITGNTHVGGLVGVVKEDITLTDSLVSGSVTITEDNSHGGVIGVVDGTSDVQSTYWVTDTTGQDSSANSNDETNYGGLPLNAMQCPTTPNVDASDMDCIPSDTAFTLFNNWHLQGVWDFGLKDQLPGLRLHGDIHRDSNGDGSMDTPAVIVVYSDLILRDANFAGSTPNALCNDIEPPQVDGLQHNGRAPFISTALTDLRERVPLQFQNRPVVGPKGLSVPVTDNWMHFFSERPLHNALYTAGINYWPKNYHTGTNSEGRFWPQKSCDNWTSVDANAPVRQGTIESGGRFTYSSDYHSANCNRKTILLCIAY